MRRILFLIFPPGGASCWAAPLAAALAGLLLSSGARAFEFAEGRVQIHGFYEAQIRALTRDFDFSDGIDLAQWWNVLNIEIEADLAPDGWGPFDIVSFFSRVEVRYDCVWTRACGISTSADAYGHRARRLPKRLIDGRGTGFTATMFTGDTRHFNVPRSSGVSSDVLAAEGSRKPLQIFQVDGIEELFGIAGLDGIVGTGDDPAPFFMQRFARCRYGSRKTKGPANGVGSQNLLLGIDGCDIEPIGSLRALPNPFRGAEDAFGNVRPDGGDFDPIIGSVGSGELPYRPAPTFGFGDSNAGRAGARGLFIPNSKLAQLVEDGELEGIPNFSEAKLAWNRGLSQQDEGELKELYLDVELFDSRLWLRLGKQNIVWGKTELFRTTDQFNPQDLALSSLPSLEESRIPLWAIRAVYSLYSVGPLEDVRIELGVNIDEFEISDFGRCGEPFSPLPVCGAFFGLQIHGVTGLGLAGLVSPPDPWDSGHGIEYGARIEWRWDRFSFALTDFYGFNDLPYIEQVYRYTRNVDPRTGRIRQGESRGACLTGSEPDCLQASEALALQPSNQQLFAWICAMTIGAAEQDRRACGNTIFNSKNNFFTEKPLLENEDPSTAPILAALLTNALAGNFGSFQLLGAQVSGFPLPRVPLSVDVNDGALPSHAFFASSPTLNATTTAEQQALVGCGPFFQTNCEIDGIDLLNAEASALFQSWPGVQGTFFDWDTTDPNVAQPGTVQFRGGPVCTRFEGGKTFILPGCRGPGYENPNSGFDPGVDGSPSFFLHPFFDPGADGICGTPGDPSDFCQSLPNPAIDQFFVSEMAALSFNFLMAVVGFSAPPDGEPANSVQFDASDAYRTDGCSLAKPHLCFAYPLIRFTGVQRNTVRAGGNGRFGRLDFVWHMGAPVIARFNKRNVLGFSADWAEDVTKSNWSFEFTWFDDELTGDNDKEDGLTTLDLYNLTVSVDRPTFVNFLNQNRTFFFNTQWFFQYIDGYRKNTQGSGPFNVLATFAINTGYFQDRLFTTLVFVYDFPSNSGAVLPSFTYRFTENFSTTFGMALFAGRFVLRDTALTQLGPVNRVGKHAYKDATEPGLSAVRERDEFFLTIRYTF